MASSITRKIIKIDEDKCNGCGECITACHEGALALVDGKAKLVKDDFCDGLGACIGECPQDALTFEEREAVPFDEAAVEQHLAALRQPATCPSGGCPSAQARTLRTVTPCVTEGQIACGQDAGGPEVESALANWPTQLMLVPVQAQYLQGADLLISADCVPFAYAGFHQDLLPGKVVLQACPKLDDINHYREKLTAMLVGNTIRSVTVARMEVPCCGGLVAAVRHALDASGKELPLEVVTVGVGGDVLERQQY